MPRTPLAWQNLTHDRVRFLLFVMGVVFAVVLMFVQLGFRGALLDAQSLIPEHLNGDLVLVSPNRQAVPMREPFPRRRLAQAAAVPGVRAALPLFVDNGLGIVRDTRPDAQTRLPSRAARIIGLDPAAHLLTLPELDPTDPRFQGSKLTVPGTALFDRLTRPGEKEGETVFGPLAEGTTTELAGRRVTFVGSFALGSDFTSEGCIVLSEQTFADLLRRPYTYGAPLADVDFGIVRLAPAADVEAVRRALKEAFAVGEPEPDVDVLTPAELVAREQRFWLANTPIGFAFDFGMVMGFAVGLVICYQILSGDVADHLPEYATLKAFGYPNRYLAWVVIQEALVLAVCGYAVGLAISWAAYLLLTDATGLPLRMTAGRAGQVLAVTVGMCVVSALIALVRLLRADPADVF
ncbi:MAG: FtsX-like permease family protein [Gemmataceae bacterium]